MSFRAFVKKVIRTLRTKKIIGIPSYVDRENILSGKNVLIVGGTGGIGFAITKKFLASGANIIITGSTEEKVKRQCEIIKSEKVKGVQLDLGKPVEFQYKIAKVCQMFEKGNIDILVNCAGVNTKNVFFDVTESDWDKTIDINLKGIYFLTQEVAKHMIKNKVKGHILNISSSSALRPAKSPYEISKWAIKGFTLGMADLLFPHGIVVNAIAPGPTATPMLSVNENDSIEFPSCVSGRYTMPEEIANLALILVSEIGDIVVGDTLYATNGSGLISLHR